MELTFLGTSSMVPTVDRNHSAVLLSYNDEALLFDCGEGTQRQLRIADIRPTKITKILISHWHGDHILGLPGLIQTLGACEYSGTLEIYGPEGTKEFLGRILDSFVLDTRIRIKAFDVKPGIFFENDDFYLEAASLRHGARCLAYAFVEKEKRRINIDYLKPFGLQKHPILRELQKGNDIEWKGHKILAKDATIIKPGKKITYATDTLPCENIVRLADGSDLLICEATLEDSLREKAEASKHMTSVQAAEIAKKANVKKLILTHFSQRYKSTAQIKKEAREIFKHTECAKDFMKVEI